jgi:hypothetical protein
VQRLAALASVDLHIIARHAIPDVPSETLERTDPSEHG